MKKKILSLLVAGVVALGTAMPASADVIQGDKGASSTNANVTVTGTVNKGNNEAPAGRIQVEMPTQLSFTVMGDGTLNAVPFNIQNRGEDAVKVTVASFSETNTSGGITLNNDDSGLDSKDRANVYLTLKGDNSSSVVLKSTGTDTSTVLATIEKDATKTITLEGKAGKDKSSNTNLESNGTDEVFNLVFKIAKNA